MRTFLIQNFLMPKIINKTKKDKFGSDNRFLF